MKKLVGSQGGVELCQLLLLLCYSPFIFSLSVGERAVFSPSQFRNDDGVENPVLGDSFHLRGYGSGVKGTRMEEITLTPNHVVREKLHFQVRHNLKSDLTPSCTTLNTFISFQNLNLGFSFFTYLWHTFHKTSTMILDLGFQMKEHVHCDAIKCRFAFGCIYFNGDELQLCH